MLPVVVGNLISRLRNKHPITFGSNKRSQFAIQHLFLFAANIEIIFHYYRNYHANAR